MNAASFVLALHHTPARRAFAPMAVGIPALRRILTAISDRGYRFVGIDAVGASGLPKRTATVTVDDGYASNVRYLRPLLRELGIPWTVFISVRTLGGLNRWDLDWVGHRERHMTEDELRTLTAEGVRVGSHGMEHEDLTKASPSALAESLTASRAALTAIAGRPVDAIAYPWGRVDERVASSARSAGYRVGFALDAPGRLPPSLTGMAIPRTCVYSPDQILGLFASTAPWAPKPFRAMRGALSRTGRVLVETALAARRLAGVRP